MCSNHEYMRYIDQLTQVSDYVEQYYQDHADERLYYHNIAHTKEMLEACKKIAEHYQLNDHDGFIVYAAAWFHDVGYLTSESEFHEAKSAEIAEQFLKNIGVSEEDILKIKGCIMATKLPQGPSNLLEEIVGDADLYHLGTELFKEKSKLLKKEAEALKNTQLDNNEWRLNNIRLLETHRYHTDFGRLVLEQRKKENLEKLKKKVEEKASKHPPPYVEPDLNNDVQLNLTYGDTKKLSFNTGIPKPIRPETEGDFKTWGGKGKKAKRSEKSIETMFRIASANHQRLSSMADNKAHIMISVNSIIISVALGLVVRKLDENRNLVVPTIILLLMNVITIIYSVLATRPKIPTGYFSRDQVMTKSINLLFFGNFYKMGYADYDWGMKRMMNDKEFLYESLINDMYWHGVVLGKKYRLLRTSYSVFMYGIAISVVAYTLAIIFIK